MAYKDREENLKQRFKSLNIDALLVEDATNLFYLTGLELSSGQLLVTSRQSLLFVDNRYFELCQKLSPFKVILSDKEPLNQMLLTPDLQFIKNLGIDSESMSYQRYLELDQLNSKLKEQSSGRCNIKLIALNNPVKQLRSIKDADEIKMLKEAAILGSLGFDYVCTLLKTGIKEIEVARELEIFWKKKGSKSLSFDPIIAFGTNSSMPHYRSQEIELKKGDPVLIDIGVNYKHYQSDMTRMVFFGTPPEQISVIFPIVRRAQELALLSCKPGAVIGDIDAQARSFIESQGYGENFGHGLGHGVGLEIHELPMMRNKPPYNSVKLEPGMVVTIEPGIYLPNIGGVRIEDTILITEDGYESLTNRPTSPVIID